MTMKCLFWYKSFKRCLMVTLYIYTLSSTSAQRCDNLLGLDDCIDADIYTDRWKKINEEKCGTQQGNVMHCQKLQSGNICSICANKILCHSGTYPRIDTLTKSVSCLPCGQGWYQREPKASYHFKTPSCDSKQTDCKDRKTLCLNGSALEDNKCRCDHRAGFRPTERGCGCFAFNSICECTTADCPRGEKLDSNYDCIPVSTVRTETNKTTTNPADIGKSSEPEESALKIEGIVGIVIAVLFASLLAGPYLWYKIDQRNKKEKIGFLSWLCHKRHPRSKKEKSSAPGSSDGRNLHTSEGSPLVLSNGTAHSVEECKTKGPIVQISSDGTQEMALSTTNGDPMREVLHKVREENLKYQLASKPTNLTQTINANKVNMVYGDHGCIRQETNTFERRESSDMSSLDADGGDERQNHPMLSSDDEQEPRNKLFVNVDQAGTSQRPGDQGGTNQRPGDRGGTSQRPGDRAGTNQIELDGQSSIDRRENENQPIISFVENGNGETVDKEQTLVKLV